MYSGVWFECVRMHFMSRGLSCTPPHYCAGKVGSDRTYFCCVQGDMSGSTVLQAASCHTLDQGLEALNNQGGLDIDAQIHVTRLH